MLTRTSVSTFIALSVAVAAQSTNNNSTPTVVCIAGQCLQGYSNITLGAQLSTTGSSVHLLPGQYTASTNPSLLHGLLTSSSAILSPAPGFDGNSSTVSLPLNVNLSPGLAVYSSSLYSGQTGFTALPTQAVGNNTSIPLSASALVLSTNVWAALSSSGDANSRVIFWDAVPDVSQLPSSTTGSLSLLDLQSAACSPPCSGSGVCSASGQCTCPAGFTGSSCESCATGFFGPTCQSCPSNCPTCDEGISGSGRCLTSTIANAPSTCNCLNGVCGSNGQCTCTSGFTTADNGTACAKCSDGFFLTSTGDCQICQLGCGQCADTTGACIACKSGFTQDANDKTKCTAQQSVTSAGTVCPDGSFSAGTDCSPCSPSCDTCTGGTSNDCIICGSGKYSLNGACVAPDSNGVCAGSTMIADNNKHECDSCGAKCTSCGISNFNAGSTVNQLQCTGCIPGSFLSGGKCVDSCPSGTFVSPTDNFTCTPCDSSCATCSDSDTFCTSCPSNRLASAGSCVASCPSNTVSSNGSCLPCHPDCASCSGTAFNQCSSCPQNRPVLTSGRCLPTCSKNQFFDKTSSTCVSCDSSCSSCVGAGPTNCLACSSSTQVLRGGSCVAANCQSNSDSSSVVVGLGMCLSEVVFVPKASGTNSAPPLPSITGLTSPTIVKTTTTRKLEWWEILLMALGCAFIFLVIVVCWRRRARKQRAKRTRQFAAKKSLDVQSGWRWRLMRFGEKLFGHNASKKSTRGPVALDEEDGEAIKLMRLRDAEEARHHMEMENIISSYATSSKQSSRRAPSALPPLSERPTARSKRIPPPTINRLSANSLYSQVTGMPRTIAEPRQPVKESPPPVPRQDVDLLGGIGSSRYSSSTLGSYYVSPRHRERELQQQTDAEAYARAVRPTLGINNDGGTYWVEPTPTGGSGSNNPFRTKPYVAPPF